MSSVEVLRQMLAGLQVIEHELLLFAAFWFIISALDEVAIDLRVGFETHDRRANLRIMSMDAAA